jgi:hypothetical protein
MNNSLNTSLRIVVAALACAIFFAPVNANAYTSTGADGYFQPGASIVLDLTQPIFNFTSIFIPGGVTVSFGGLTSAQPIELLAAGNIDIAGILDVGANNLWIETPGSISFSGTLNSSGGTLSLVAGNINFTGAITGTLTGGKGVPTDRGGILASEGGDINITGGANLSVGGGDAIRSGVGSVTGGSGAISIVSGGGIVNTGAGDISGNVSLLSPVPEPDGWALFAAGLVVTGFTAYRRRSVSGYQK